MKFKHDCDLNVHITIGLEPCLMKLLTSMLSGDDESKLATALSDLQQHTDKAAGELSTAKGGGIGQPTSGS